MHGSSASHSKKDPLGENLVDLGGLQLNNAKESKSSNGGHASEKSKYTQHESFHGLDGFNTNLMPMQNENTGKLQNQFDSRMQHIPPQMQSPSSTTGAPPPLYHYHQHGIQQQQQQQHQVTMMMSMQGMQQVPKSMQVSI